MIKLVNIFFMVYFLVCICRVCKIFFFVGRILGGILFLFVGWWGFLVFLYNFLIKLMLIDEM